MSPTPPAGPQDDAPRTDEPRSLRLEDWLTVIVMALLALITFANVLVRYFGCHWGYNSGMKALNRFEELGLTEKIFTAAAIIGLLVIGGMSASMVSINPVVAIGSGDNAIKLIDVINGIMPKMLSLLTTLGVYRLLKKGMKPNTILLGIIVVSVLLTAIGIF